MIYGTATYYRHLRFEPPAIDLPRGRRGRARHVAIEQRATRLRARTPSLGYAGRAD